MNPLGPKTPVSKPLRPREPIIYLTCLGGCGAPEPVSQDVMDHRTFCLSCFLLIASLIPPPSPFSFLLPVSPSLPISPSPWCSYTQLGPALPSSPIVFPSWQFPPHTQLTCSLFVLPKIAGLSVYLCHCSAIWSINFIKVCHRAFFCMNMFDASLMCVPSIVSLDN